MIERETEQRIREALHRAFDDWQKTDPADQEWAFLAHYASARDAGAIAYFKQTWGPDGLGVDVVMNLPAFRIEPRHVPRHVFAFER